MKIEIKNRYTSEIIFAIEAKSIKLAVKAAIEQKISLSYADLRAANLSDADLRAADLRAANLRAANLSGADLRAADLRAANLSAANLSDADLSAADLGAADLRAANLRAANLSAADLRAADLRAANLSDADLSDANLNDANLSDALIPSLKLITPVKNLDSQILQRIEAGGELNMVDWHQCETTHCRAGWAIMIAPEGQLLESLVGPNAAAALIYAASYPGEKIPNFFAETDDALADIKARAAKETAKK